VTSKLEDDGAGHCGFSAAIQAVVDAAVILFLLLLRLMLQLRKKKRPMAVLSQAVSTPANQQGQTPLIHSW